MDGAWSIHTWNPSHNMELTLFPAWISNYIHYKMVNEITYSFPNLHRYNRWRLRMDKCFHPTFYWACRYLSMLGLKLIYVTKFVSGLWYKSHRWFMQERRNSIANALELCLSCTNPSTYDIDNIADVICRVPSIYLSCIPVWQLDYVCQGYKMDAPIVMKKGSTTSTAKTNSCIVWNPMYIWHTCLRWSGTWIAQKHLG